MTSLSRRHLIESPSFGKKKGLTKMAVFSKHKKKTLAEMIAKAVKEQRPRLEEDLTGRTIGINEFRRKYCGGKSPEWVRTFVFDRFPEVDYTNGGWVVNPHRGEGSRGTIIFERRAAEWMDSHQLDIDWNARLAK